MKLLYKTKKWDNEVREKQKVLRDFAKRCSDKYMQQMNIETNIQVYLHPEPVPRAGTPRVGDEASLWYSIASKYFLWSWYDYELRSDAVNCVKHMYLYVLAMSQAYELWKSGMEITNGSILKAISEMRDMSQTCFSAVVVDEFPRFEKFAEGDGEIIKAMYYEDYDKVRKLIQKLPDTEEMYKKNKDYMSFYYDADFLKDLYQSILEQDEEAFNKALERRIRNVRGGYVMPVDVVSLTMIKFARRRGMDYNIDVIEIPKFFLDNLKIDKENYKLPDLNSSEISVD